MTLKMTLKVTYKVTIRAMTTATFIRFIFPENAMGKGSGTF